MELTQLQEGTFTGKVKKKRTIKDFVLTESYHYKNEQVSNHAHENPYLSFVLNGYYGEKSIIKNDIVESGYALFRAKNYEHQNQIGQCGSLCFNLEIKESQLQKYHKSNEAKVIYFERNNLELLNIILAFRHSIQSDLLSLTLEENLSQLFYFKELRNSIVDSYWVSKLMNEVRLSPERIYTIEDLANTFKLHPVYFVRKFKDKVGLSFTAFLVRERLRKAIELMKNHESPLTEIALNAGFYDQSHFIRHFKSVFKSTPKVVRKYIG